VSQPIPHEEIARRNALARASLAHAGIISSDEFWRHPSSPPQWRLETGHRIGVGVHPETGEYGMNVTHQGDPSGNTLVSMLGTHDESQIPDRLNQEFRHRETMGHLRDMYVRAANNNDPTGAHPEAQRVSRDWASDPQYIMLNHYE
jgi:hypothetical protein